MACWAQYPGLTFELQTTWVRPLRREEVGGKGSALYLLGCRVKYKQSKVQGRESIEGKCSLFAGLKLSRVKYNVEICRRRKLSRVKCEH